MKATTNTKNSKTDCPVSAGSPQPFQPFRTLMRHRWQFLACLLMVCGIALAATLFRKDKYEAIARVQVVMDQPKLGGLAGLAGSGDYFSTQCQLLLSRHVLARTAEKLHSAGSTGFGSDDGIDALRGRLKIKPVAGSRLIDIIGIAENGPLATAIANQTTAAFIETSIESRRAANEQIIKRVNEQIAKSENEIQAQEENIRRFRQENLITGSGSALSAALTRIGTIEAELTRVQLQRLQLQAQRDKAEKLLTNGQIAWDEEISFPEIANDSEVRKLTEKINNLQQEEAQLARVYLPGHQKLQEVRRQLEDLQAKLLGRKQNLLQGYYDNAVVQYDGTIKQEESFLSLLRQLKEIGVKLTERQQRYESLAKELEIARKFREECVGRVREFMLEEGMSESPVMVVDAAQIPACPMGLSKSHRAASILLLGLLFSVLFVLVVDRFRTAAQVPAPEFLTMPMPMYPPNWPMPWSLPVNMSRQGVGEDKISSSGGISSPGVMMGLGKIGNINLAGKGRSSLALSARCRVAHADQSSPAAQAFREIVGKLISRFGQTRQSVVLTAVSPCSGTSTCACNMALILAGTGRKVLLVDANLQRGVLSNVFPLDHSKPSFAAVLRNMNLLDQALQETDIPNLTVLAPNTEEETPIAHGIGEIAQLDKVLARQFDWIIYDADCLERVFTADLLQAVGKAVLVINDAPGLDATIAVKRLEQSGAVSLGCIENSCPVVDRVSDKSSAKA